MLILPSLKLNSGVFALFYHYALGKYSKNKTSSLSLFYLLGTEVISAFLFLSIFYLNYIFFFFSDNLNNNLFSLIIAGIFIMLSLVSFFYYFRHNEKKGTRLFISKNSANALNKNAKSIKTRSDAFFLGAFAGTSELIFTLPVYIIFSYELIELNFNVFATLSLIFIFILTPLIPLLFIRILFGMNYNLADYLRIRFKNKTLTRLTLFICYLFIALLILNYRITL